MKWNPADLADFFGSEAKCHEGGPFGRYHTYHVDEGLVRCMITVNPHLKNVAIQLDGVDQEPYTGVPIFSTSVPCGLIRPKRGLTRSETIIRKRLGLDEDALPERFLLFFKGGDARSEDRVLAATRRKDGRLGFQLSYP